MALKKPLVVGSDGLPQQLQAGDTLDAAQGGGDVQVMTNANAGAVVIGTPVYCSANSSCDKARANAGGTSKVVGLVKTASVSASASGEVVVGGVLTATTGQWDAVTGGSGGLTRDTRYFLDPGTAGLLTTTPPSTVGQYVVCVGIALSTTEMLVRVREPILL